MAKAAAAAGLTDAAPRPHPCPPFFFNTARLKEGRDRLPLSLPTSGGARRESGFNSNQPIMEQLHCCSQRQHSSQGQLRPTGPEHRIICIQTSGNCALATLEVQQRSYTLESVNWGLAHLTCPMCPAHPSFPPSSPASNSFVWFVWVQHAALFA